MSAQVSRKGQEITVVISQTSVATATEIEIPLGITRGRLLRIIADKTAGDASNIDPVIGIATNPAGSNIVFEQGTGAVTIDNQIVGGATFSTSSGSLFYRPKPDSGTNNAVTTILHILVGW
tara:strand:- start:196 stop:558 length:363 start_codon:yes stop_codon:yes gene_type:complete